MERRASWLELFFDLVLVAAVGALATRLHHDHALLTFAGLFVPVWWAWWGFTWWSTAFNADGPVDRAALLLAMAGAAALAAGVEDAGTTFVVAYASLFALLAALYARAWQAVPAMRPLSARYALGYALGAALWLLSLLFADGARPVVWTVAMVVLMAAPVLAAASVDVLSYDAAHIAERYGLFTLIVLGESVVATVAGLDAGAASVTIALLGLVIAAAVWWLYFDRFRGMPAQTVRAGFVWAQGHLFVFAGIAAAAVGVELAIEAPGDLAAAERLPLGAGLAAYLAAMALIRAATNRLDWVVGLRAGAGAAVLGLSLVVADPLLLVALTALVMVAECAVDLLGAPPPPAARVPLPHQAARYRAQAADLTVERVAQTHG